MSSAPAIFEVLQFFVTSANSLHLTRERIVIAIYCRQSKNRKFCSSMHANLEVLKWSNKAEEQLFYKPLGRDSKIKKVIVCRLKYSHNELHRLRKIKT